MNSAELKKSGYPQVPGSIPAENTSTQIPAENTSTQIHMDLSK